MHDERQATLDAFAERGLTAGWAEYLAGWADHVHHGHQRGCADPRTAAGGRA